MDVKEFTKQSNNDIESRIALKFKDVSLVFKKRGQIVSVFPAAIIKKGEENILFSSRR